MAVDPTLQEHQEATLRQAMADYFISREHVAYVKTHNPAHAWQAYRVARQCGAPVPEWTLAYFDACVTPILDATNNDQIATAIGLIQKKGGRSKAAQTRTTDRDLEIVSRFLDLKHRAPTVTILETPESDRAKITKLRGTIATLQAERIDVPLTDIDCAEEVAEAFGLTYRTVLDIVYSIIPSTKLLPQK